MADFVRALQRLMQEHGEPLPKFGADGQWGAEGQEALDRLLKGRPTAVIPDAYWPMLSKIESGDRPYVKASTSSASGLYQFIRSTWLAEGGDWGGDSSKAFGGLTPSPAEQLMRAKAFTQRNADFLAARGVVVNPASLYAAHFLGAPGAARLLSPGVGVNAPLEGLTGADQRRANPSILGAGKTVADFLTWLHKKTGVWAR